MRILGQFPVRRLTGSWLRSVILYRGEMRSIRYSLHFRLLIVAVFVFWLAKDIRFPASISNIDFFHYGLMGVLHATVVVVSLRDRKANHPIIALCFMILATVWSAATPILGLWSSIVWTPIYWTPLAEILRSSGFGFVLILLTGSAIGAAGYWLLVRLFWLKSLRYVEGLRSVALCVAATLLACAATVVLPKRNVPDDATSLILTAAWWFAFSISLFWSETSGHAKTSAAAMAGASLNS